jgi:aryl-alcohol dehydrogenase-like predicted oxidoreductase
MSLTDYVTLGRSGLRVSPLCLGSMTFGLDWGFGSDVATAQHIVETYLDRGGNFIDTANIYTKGHSEKILGSCVGNHPRRRAKAVLATKFMGNLYSGDPNGGGASRKAIFQQLEQSLRRLQTDYIDLYWMHFYDRFTPIDETMRALDDLVRQGKVRYIGFSDTPAWKCAQAQVLAEWRGWTPLVALQIEYSLLERTVEQELVPMAMELGLGITPWSPLKGGVLSGKYTSADAGAALAAQNAAPGASGGATPGAPKKPGRGEWVTRHLTDRNLSVVDALRSFAKQLGASPSQVALAWVQSRPGVTSTIIGARTMEQLSDNLKALELHLLPEQHATLDELTKPVAIFPHTFLPFTASVTQGGTTINGLRSEPWPMAPKSDNERH